PARQRLDRDRGHAVLGDQVERGLGPVLGAQAPLAFRLLGCRCRCGRRHRDSVSIRHPTEQYRFPRNVLHGNTPPARHCVEEPAPWEASVPGKGRGWDRPVPAAAENARFRLSKPQLPAAPLHGAGRILVFVGGHVGDPGSTQGGAMFRAMLFLLLLALAGAARAGATAPDDRASAARVQAAMALPDGLRQALPALELDRLPELDRVRRLFEFMVSEEGLGLRYLEQPTYGIAESYERREVNCLSFTMMFIAL